MHFGQIRGWGKTFNHFLHHHLWLPQVYPCVPELLYKKKQLQNLLKDHTSRESNQRQHNYFLNALDSQQVVIRNYFFFLQYRNHVRNPM